MRGGGDQQERRIAYRHLHRSGFLFGIFGFIQDKDFAARYAQALCHSGPGFCRTDRICFCRCAGKDEFRARIFIPQADPLRQPRQAIIDEIGTGRPVRVPGVASAKHDHVLHALFTSPRRVLIFNWLEQAIGDRLQAQQQQQQPAEADAELAGTLETAKPQQGYAERNEQQQQGKRQHHTA